MQASQSTNEDRILRSIMFGEQQLTSDVAPNCLYKSYISLTEGNFKQSLNQINTCPICRSINKHVNYYYCKRIAASSYMWMGEYDSAHKEIEKILNLSKKLTELGLDLHSLESLSNYLNNTRVEKKEKIHLSKNIIGEFVFKGFIIDTGSIFNAQNRNCVEKIANSEVYFITGDAEKFDICDDAEMRVPYILYPKNIIGLIHTSSYKHVILDELSPSIDKIKLNFDFDTIFFKAKTDFDNDIVNACVDTGSLTSSVNFKFFRKHHVRFKNIETITINSSNNHGELKSRGKILKSLKIKFGNSSFEFVNIPMFIDRTPWFHCDITVGRDLISSLFKEIDFNEQFIEIK
ncbi:MAG: hypothetical protein ACK5NH_07120 [Shewanella sp.]